MLDDILKKVKANSLFHKILIVALFITITHSLILGLIHYFSFKDRLLNEAKKNLEIIAINTSSQIYEKTIRSLSYSQIKNLNDSEILDLNYQTLKNQLYFTQSKAVDLLEFDGTVYLLDSKGELILSGQPNPKIDPNYFQNNQVSNREDSEIATTQKISATGYFSYKKKGQEYIAAYSRINTFDWTIVIDGKKIKF
ncbi:hypothetical protein [Halanaerobacter jeridensis]|uniref:Uncharacterized protein n=1 Tax=Halanaerobacter jeridensis TaxID=706427 RepID=A0A939BMH9_9FIRM|nr:hypothetical protein [Halanaerobacter jeridensis]MBM7556520.1 hypothetical protein [Halanaerobacter jeridensis]